MVRFGVDISNWNHVYDLKATKEAGYVICYIEATDGITWQSPVYAAQVAAAAAADLEIGPYHFFEPADNGVSQAMNFLRNTEKDVKQFKRAMVVDLEVRHNESSEQYLQTLNDFLVTVGKYRETPVLYYSPAFWKDLGSPANYKQHPVWLAEYGPAPEMPDEAGTMIGWQFTSTGAVAGIRGQVDLTKWFD